jgi:hypothetical protein
VDVCLSCDADDMGVVMQAKLKKGMTNVVIGASNLLKKKKKKKKKHGWQGCVTHSVGEVMGSGDYPALRCVHCLNVISRVFSSLKL